VRLEGLGQLKKKIIYLIGNPASDFPACPREGKVLGSEDSKATGSGRLCSGGKKLNRAKS
jgi:hypothetical protein